MKHTVVKRTWAFVLSLIMIMLPLTIPSFADEWVEPSTSADGLYRYQVINEDEACIVELLDYDYELEQPKLTGTLEIPSEIDGYTVTEIGGLDVAFCAGNITEFIIPDTVKVLHRSSFYAFTDNKVTEKIFIPASVTTIEDDAFYWCDLAEITVDESNPNFCVKNHALYTKDMKELVYCPITAFVDGSFKVPETVETIRSGAFSIHCDASSSKEWYDIDLEKIVIGNNVKEIYEDWGFIALGTKVYCPENSAAHKLCTENGIPFILTEMNDYPDVAADAWFYNSVMYCKSRGIITGYKNGNFGPANKLQRQDFAVILARLYIGKSSLEANYGFRFWENEKYPDIARGSYYEKACHWAILSGYITGYQNGKFGVGDSITREQVATIFYRLKGSPDVSAYASVINSFADKGKISSFAKDAMIWAVQNGVISGKNATTLDPTGTASRAEIATIIMRMDQNGLL